MNNEDFELPYLSTFLAVAESGSFTAAGKALGLSQAAVSLRIQALERRLRTSVFQRRGDGVALTEAGLNLMHIAEAIGALHRKAIAEVGGHTSPIAGSLVIGASSVPGEVLLPLILPPFREQFPAVQVRVKVSDSADVMRHLQKGHVDIGMVGRLIETPRFRFDAIAEDRMILAVPTDHRFARRKRIKFTELQDEPLILREEGSGIRHCFETALARAGLARGDLTIAMELGSNEAIKQAVLHGAGIAVLSRFVIQKELESGQLHALDLQGLRCNRDIYVVRDEQRPLSPPAQAFLLFLETHPPSR